MGDIITTLPDRQNCSLCRNILCKPSVYRHCGPKIILQTNGDYEIAFEKDDAETFWRFLREARYTFGHGIGFVMMIPALIRYKNFFLTNHGCGTYMDRFNKKLAMDGRDLYLNDIFRKEVKVLKKKQGRNVSKKQASVDATGEKKNSVDKQELKQGDDMEKKQVSGDET